ncbi:ABC transporter substrate-binding protein [uncultured Chitinophaga sp.]|jgi:ABC-type Fe3+-hydroxamate transport system, periplasmic component|uniref:ABC transporter substrate-binding protein n=1 Tax=uncultured Chitinophaga sp. TaxID=339340 RepID=UPI0026097950|nr:helical backbone metal receptor [uncultured Chitinophaga sp.]
MEVRTYIDQLQNTVHIPYPPQRIVSLVPSQTELLYHLGLDAEVVGITKFCIHPEQWFRHKTRIGGTRQLHIEQIKALQPDLVIANKEENAQEQVRALMADFPVWTSDIRSLPDALSMIREIGVITGRAEQALQLSADISREFSLLNESVARSTRPPQAAYFIWRDPWMVAGGDTFIHTMLEAAGLQNIFSGMQRYPSISLSRLAEAFAAVPPASQFVLLSSEPYPFKEKHIGEIRACLPEARVLLVDGEMFSWYGSRLLEAPGYFRQLFS